MYQKLIDTVCAIVKSHGTSILSEPKFWNILKDSYSFASDYSLRNCFLHCINEGYINECLQKGSKKDVLKYIDTLLKKNKNKNSFTDIEIASCMFSIAISTGICNRGDYNSFSQRLKGYQTNNSSPQPSSNPKPQSKSPGLTMKEKNLLFWVMFFGILILLGSISFYSALFHGWWLFFIILFGAIPQLGYSSYLLNYMSETKDCYFKNLVASCTFPIMVGLLLNCVFAFFLFSDSILHGLAHYLNGFISSDDSPGFLSFLLNILYLFIIFSCGMCIYSDQGLSSTTPRIIKKPLIYSSVGVTLIVGSWVATPGIREGIMIHKIHVLNAEYAKEYTTQIAINDSLRRIVNHEKAHSEI